MTEKRNASLFLSSYYNQQSICYIFRRKSVFLPIKHVESTCMVISRGKQLEIKEILVRNNNRIRNVPADDIIYIESNNRKVILHTKKEMIEYYDKIGELEKALKPEFFRIHKGYLVHMRDIEYYGRTEVHMKNGDDLLISKYRFQDFVKTYENYISKKTD